MCLQFCKEKFRLICCVRVQRNCTATRETGTGQTAGQIDVASVKSTICAQNRLTEVTSSGNMGKAFQFSSFFAYKPSLAYILDDDYVLIC